MDKNNTTEIYLSFYGDDFTGSTDVMESLSLHGLPTALFLHPPSQEEVHHFKLKNNAYTSNGKLQAFGVAGVSRTMNPARMSRELPGIFEKISKIPSRYFHYKICSTFDSSPETGNIGHAVDLALAYFPSDYIPLLVGAPDLNRFCIFGNLYARVDKISYRLDRHPTMAKHPVTPMTESDLRLHLKQQTTRKIHLLEVLDLDDPIDISSAVVQKILNPAAPDFLLFDVLNNAHLKKIGKLLEINHTAKTQLIVGSSAVENALAPYIREESPVFNPPNPPQIGKADKVIVMAGSCSPGTQIQIEWGLKKGFVGIRINTLTLLDPELKEEEMERLVLKANQALRGSHIILYTALGPEDDAIIETREKFNSITSHKISLGEYLSQIQGMLLREIYKANAGSRVVVAGGDTSGQAALALEIYALEILRPIAPGAPLCLAHSNNPLFDGMEIALKGGQNGNEKYFESILEGELLI